MCVSSSRSGADVHNGAMSVDSEMLMPDTYLFLVLITFNFINIKNIGKIFLFFLLKDKGSVLFYGY